MYSLRDQTGSIMKKKDRRGMDFVANVVVQNSDA